MSNLKDFINYKLSSKPKVGDMVGYPADKPKIFAICSEVFKSGSGYIVVSGRWAETKEIAEAASIGRTYRSRSYYRLKDVVVITDYVKKPFIECGDCIGCEKVKQPSQCRFDCPQKEKIIKKLLEIK